MSKIKKVRTIIWPLTIILLLSACTSTKNKDTILKNNSDSKMISDEKEAKEDIAADQGIETLEPVLTLNQALDFFHNTFETNTVNFDLIEFNKNESGSYHYFIEGWDEQYDYQLTLDVGTAEIIDQEKERGNGNGDKLDLDAAIIPKEAMDAALIDNEVETVASWVLKVDPHNRMIYEINFVSGMNEEIDALSGQVQ